MTKNTLTLLIATTAVAIAAVANGANGYPVRDAPIDTLRHHIANHESELQSLDAKLQNLEEMIDTIRQQQHSHAKDLQDSFQRSGRQEEAKLILLEGQLKELSAQLTPLRTATEGTALQIQRLEKSLTAQEAHIQSLQNSMKALVALLDDPEEGAVDIYQVKSGDSLDKIAQRQKVSVKSIKELNGLTNDKIIVGQKLRIPRKEPTK
jgi:LysM repeat protein/outer membrane murein-binding lipoprotein Lpp